MIFFVFLFFYSFFIQSSTIENIGNKFNYKNFTTIIEIDHREENYITSHYPNLTLVSKTMLETIGCYRTESIVQ